MIRRPPRSTLFPSPTLFRSARRSTHDAAPSPPGPRGTPRRSPHRDRKSTRLNSSHDDSSYAVFCLEKSKVVITALDSAPFYAGTGVTVVRTIANDNSTVSFFFFKNGAPPEYILFSPPAPLPF